MPTSNIMDEIKQLAKSYQQHLKEPSWESDQYYLKWTDIQLILFAETPQAVMDILHSAHKYYPQPRSYDPDYKRLEVLRYSRTPWPIWWIEFFLILFTFPVSIPYLMHQSWKARGTVNFLKTDGSIFVDKLLALCREAGITAPTPPKTDDKPSKDEPTQGSTMQTSTSLNTGAIKPSAPQSLVVRNSEARPATQAAPPLPTLDEEMEGNANMVDAFSRMFFSNPHTFLDACLSCYEGEPILLASQPLQHMHDHQYRLTYTYKTLWTDEAPVDTALIVFSAFKPLRRPTTTAYEPIHITPPPAATTVREVASSMVAYGRSFFTDDVKTLIEKGLQPRGPANIQKKYFMSALNKAKTEEECVSALEALINWTEERIKQCSDALDSPGFNEAQRQYYQTRKQIRLKEVEEYLDQLPLNYFNTSHTANAIQAQFDKIWAHLEKNEIAEAHALQRALEFKNPKLSPFLEQFLTPEERVRARKPTIRFSFFIREAFPHLEAMWWQLEAIFIIHGEHDTRGAFLDDTDGNEVRNFMSRTYNNMWAHHLPEAAFFLEKCATPCIEMRNHAHQTCQATPKDRIKRIAYQEDRERTKTAIDEIYYNYRTDKPPRPVLHLTQEELQARMCAHLHS